MHLKSNLSKEKSFLHLASYNSNAFIQTNISFSLKKYKWCKFQSSDPMPQQKFKRVFFGFLFVVVFYIHFQRNLYCQAFELSYQNCQIHSSAHAKDYSLLWPNSSSLLLAFFFLGGIFLLSFLFFLRIRINIFSRIPPSVTIQTSKLSSGFFKPEWHDGKPLHF